MLLKRIPSIAGVIAKKVLANRFAKNGTSDEKMV